MRRLMFLLVIASVVSLLLIPYSVLADGTWTLYLTKGGDSDNPEWVGAAESIRLGDFKEDWTFEVRVTNTNSEHSCRVAVDSEALGHMLSSFADLDAGSSVTLTGESMDSRETGIELFCRCLVYDEYEGDSLVLKYTTEIYDADGNLVGSSSGGSGSGTCCTAAYIGAAAGAVVLLAAAYGLMRRKRSG